MKSNLTNEPSELAQNFIQIASFMQNRANTRLTLKNKNSLSNLKNFNNRNTKEKNSDSKLALQQIFAQLAEQLNEGHTILTLDTTNPEQNHLYQSLKHSEWVHKLDNSQAQTIDKPIVMQVRVEHSINEWGETEMAGRVVVWLHRQWFAEHQLAMQLLNIAKRPIEQLTIEPPTSENSDKKTANERQQLAISNACNHALSIITGGPGTGKTFTVAQLVIALQHAHNVKKKKDPHTPPLSIALTAPTGKAAQRMEESLSQSLQGETIQLDKAKTLHRLLGIGNNGMPRYHHDNPLPDDLVIVDEASMLGLELASQLVDAIKPTGRLILLGDANQLAAVDAGAVLADLCEVQALQPYRTELTESRRFDDTSAIGQLALKIKQSADTPTGKKRKISEIKKLLAQKNTPITFHKFESDKTRPVNYPQIYQQLNEPFGDFFALTKDLWENPLNLDHDLTQQQVENLFQTFDTYRILSAGHHGKMGDTAINQAISHFHKREILKLPLLDSHFYHGQPIMMLKNDYQLGVFNGDIGICLKTLNAKNNQPDIVMFPDKAIDISRLNSDSCTTAYALTIHKSQGSEFHHVAVCLDGMHARLLSQELIYTAVTRSKRVLDIYSNELLLNNAIVQKGNRQTGLALQFDW